ncbi:MAG TPA: FtsX-like permease family protein [Terriglobales bacterium]|nr:FtsX-like permease family protein [Terriglobales bacterium]
MKFELFIATRYLRAKRRQAVIGIVTAISIAGVAAGVASLIVALAINNGFSQDLQTRLLGSTSHVNLLRVEADGIRNWQQLLDRLAKTPHVMAGAPAIYDQVLISRGSHARGVQLKGVIPDYESKVSDLLQTVKVGSVKPLNPTPEPPPVTNTSPDDLSAVQSRIAAMPPIILGRDLADGLGATVGSVVLVTSPQGELTPYGLVPKYERFKVVGVFDSGFYDYDATWAFTRLSSAQQLFALGDIVSVLEFKVDDIYKAGQIADELQQEAGQGFMATSWMEQNKALFRALKLEKVVTFITIGLIVFVAALNILISLIMMVMEKTKDIAVLRSMGARKRQIQTIFMAQGVLVGILGTAIGLVLGYAISLLGARYHFIALSPEVYSIDYVPFAPRLIDGFVVAAVSIGVSLIATIYPSISASRIYPAEALRYE